jgi:hypothetical protein
MNEEKTPINNIGNALHPLLDIELIEELLQEHPTGLDSINKISLINYNLNEYKNNLFDIFDSSKPTNIQMKEVKEEHERFMLKIEKIHKLYDFYNLYK